MNEDNTKGIPEKVSEFEKCLEAGSEASIHEFLASNLWMFEAIGRAYIASSKFRLANDYIPDFMIVGSARSMDGWSTWPAVTFVEIERADQKLFTKKGDPTSFLTHALTQIQNWKQWMSENRSFIIPRIAEVVEKKESETGRKFEYLEMLTGSDRWRMIRESYLLIAGRHRDLSVSDMLRLTQMNEDLKDINIITYDKVIEWLLLIYRDSRDREPWSTDRRYWS